MWTILPLKALRPIKTRLAAVLTPLQRKALMKAMVEDVLAVLQGCPDIEGVLLVSKDREISLLAEHYGAEVLALDKDEDLNSAVQAGADYLVDKGIERCLILHGDIPLIRPADLSKLVEESHAYELTLLPCHRAEGTNAMIISLPARIPFLYGRGSHGRFTKPHNSLELEPTTLICLLWLWMLIHLKTCLNFVASTKTAMSGRKVTPLGFWNLLGC